MSKPQQQKDLSSCFIVPLSLRPTLSNHLPHLLTGVILAFGSLPIRPLTSHDLRDTQVLIGRVLNPSLRGSAPQKVCTDVQRNSRCKPQLWEDFSASSPHNWAEIGVLSAEVKPAEQGWGENELISNAHTYVEV